MLSCCVCCWRRFLCSPFISQRLSFSTTLPASSERFAQSGGYKPLPPIYSSIRANKRQEYPTKELLSKRSLPKLDDTRNFYSPSNRLQSFLFTIRNASGDTLPLLYPLYLSLRKISIHGKLWDEGVLLRFLFKLRRAGKYEQLISVVQDYIHLLREGRVLSRLKLKEQWAFHDMWVLYITALCRLGHAEDAWKVIGKEMFDYNVTFTVEMLNEAMVMLHRAGEHMKALQLFREATGNKYISENIDLQMDGTQSSKLPKIFTDDREKLNMINSDHQCVSHIFALTLRCLFAVGEVEEAIAMYERIEPTLRTPFHLNALLAGLLQCGLPEAVINAFTKCTDTKDKAKPDIASYTILINALLKSQPPLLDEALNIFYRLSSPCNVEAQPSWVNDGDSYPTINEVTYTVLIQHCITYERPDLLLAIYKRMLQDGLLDPVAVTMILRYLQRYESSDGPCNTLIRQVYEMFIKAGGQPDSILATVIASHRANPTAWVVSQIEQNHVDKDTGLLEILAKRGVRVTSTPMFYSETVTRPVTRRYV